MSGIVYILNVGWVFYHDSLIIIYLFIKGNLPFLEECLMNRVSANGLDKSGSTALHWAASAGHIGK